MMPIDQIESDDYYTVVSGNKVMPGYAGDVEQFVRDHLPNCPSVAEASFAAIVEAMENTTMHAHKGRAGRSRWWLMAYHNPDDGTIRIAFLDNGAGIPSTVRKTFKEKIQDVSELVLKTGSDDGALILSALNGEFRTRVGLPQHGKGLPRIYREAKEGKLADLVLMSRRGWVRCADPTPKTSDVDFGGTLFYWKGTCDTPPGTLRLDEEGKESLNDHPH
jgi:hypothetical protein